MVAINSHIVPKHHLKQFANSDGCIFTYPDPDKHTDAQCISKGGGSVIKKTAAKMGYYSERIEQVLNQKFEYRGSQIAHKILNKQGITPDERTFFAEYIASFIYRVPATEKFLHKLYPQILKQMQSVESFMESINQPDVYRGNETDYYRVLNDLNHKDPVIKQVWENVIEAEHQQLYNVLLSKEWWIAEAIGTEYFITSDNPLFYSTKNGIADRNIQITFPLSQKMAMVFDGNPIASKKLQLEYYPASVLIHDQVNLINRRTANNSTQLYSPKRDIYIQSLLEHQVSYTEYIRRDI